MDFQKWPKIPRLNRDIIITEKIDGTNAQIHNMILSNPSDNMMEDFETKGWHLFAVDYSATDYIAVIPGSRNKYINLKHDNFGFAKWVFENAKELLGLGVGRHYGEWWGKGIQRGYGLDYKAFSLFNTNRWNVDNIPNCCRVVPPLYRGPFYQCHIDSIIEIMRKDGSFAVPGYMKPEGIVVFHTAASQTFKVTLENDEVPKGRA